jgi:hypothetical protein
MAGNCFANSLWNTDGYYPSVTPSVTPSEFNHRRI